MISPRSAVRYSKPLDLLSNYLFSKTPSMPREDEPSETKMTPVTKFFARKIPFVEE